MYSVFLVVLLFALMQILLLFLMQNMPNSGYHLLIRFMSYDLVLLCFLLEAVPEMARHQPAESALVRKMAWTG